MENLCTDAPVSPRISMVECPRDAMQGWPHFIPSADKIRYLNQLLRIGFHTLDFGSFVSAKAIPQMADTHDIIEKLDIQDSSTKLLAIIANERGAMEAAAFEKISYLGFPFSVSPTFQERNTNSTLEESLIRVEAIQNICLSRNKKLVIYLSMGFGNPYGDAYNEEILLKWADTMAGRDIEIISLADTVGIATPGQISHALKALTPRYPDVTFGVHLHSTAQNRVEKLEAALQAGCLRFDGALLGIGGCPMAQDDLTGNMPTEFMVNYFSAKHLLGELDH